MLGCGASTPPPPAATPKAEVRADDDRYPFVRGVVAALAAGDVEALVTLADVDRGYTAALDCTNAFVGQPLSVAVRESFVPIADTTRGLVLAVVRIDNVANRKGDVSTIRVPKGERVTTTCVARAELLVHSIVVKLRVGDDPREHTVSILAAWIADRIDAQGSGGRWHLLGLSLAELTKLRAGAGVGG